MVAMGEAGPSDWAEELERTGQVQFPWRSSRGWLPMAFVTVIGVQGYFGSAREMLSDDGWFIFGVIYWIGLLAMAVWCAWRLTTRQPVLTVDRTGIRYGDRKPGLLWSDVSSIGPATASRACKSSGSSPTTSGQRPSRSNRTT